MEWSAYFDFVDADGKKNYQVIGHHKCTEEDYEKFHPIEENQRKMMEMKRK